MSGLIIRYTMYVQGEYNDDWEWVGDDASLLEILVFFDFFAIFEPPQNARTRISEMSVLYLAVNFC